MKTVKSGTAIIAEPKRIAQKGKPVRLIDADALEKEGWSLHRIYQKDKATMVYEMKAISEINTAQPEPNWISCDESNPNIDMSFPHSDVYLVTYDSGEMDVARWSNVNPFWTDHVTEPRWWGVQFAKVIAWMPLPKPYEK